MPDDKEKERLNATKLIKEYFGFKEGQKLADFAEEFKALTPDDKKQLSEGIANGTLTY
jgi:hypothetical protein